MTGVALLGAGIFATTEHLPAIEAAEGLKLLAVYSRSQESAEALAEKAASKPRVYYDKPAASGKSLDDLLARDDISAVVVCLPILVQPEIIRKALKAGKHVLSEKPIAPDVAAAKSLIEYHNSLVSPRPIWGVAENFRFQPPLRYAAERVREVGGDLIAFHLTMNGFVKEDNGYFNTPWRKHPGYQGGFLLDGGIHHLAGLRFLLSAAGDEPKEVACFSSLLQERLPPVDTIHAVVGTRGGVNGTVSISFGTEFKSGLEVTIITTKGRVTWDKTQVLTVRRGSDGKPTEEKHPYTQDFGVKAEFAAFSKSLATGTVDPQQAAEEGLKDLAFLEALLRSGESKSMKTVEY